MDSVSIADRALLINDAPDRGDHRVLVGDVEGQGVRTGLAQFGQRIHAAGRGVYGVAGLGKPQGGGMPDPGGASGNENGLGRFSHTDTLNTIC
jgi:hypothetical protein